MSEFEKRMGEYDETSVNAKRTERKTFCEKLIETKNKKEKQRPSPFDSVLLFLKRSSLPSKKCTFYP